MARYNTVIPVTTTTTTASVTSPSQGVFTSLTGTAPYTVTIGDPILYAGQSQTFYNSTSGVVTLSFSTSGSGKFIGPGIAGTQTTQGLPTASITTISSDGTNWVVGPQNGGITTGTTATFSSTVTLSPSGAAVAISPTGGLTINPSVTAGTIDNTSVGVTTAAAGNFTSIGNTTRGTGKFTTLDANSTVTLSPASANVTLSPTGTGNVVINPAGTLTSNTIDNVTIGATIRGSGSFTTLNSNGLTRFTQGGQGTSTTDATHAVLVTGGLGVSGTIYSGGLVESSSIVYKENVNPLMDALSSVLQLSAVTYDRKDGSRKNEIGLIAEDVYKVAPHLVTLNAQGKPEGIQYTKISAYLIECVKSLQAEIDKLKGIK